MPTLPPKMVGYEDMDPAPIKGYYKGKNAMVTALVKIARPHSCISFYFSAKNINSSSGITSFCKSFTLSFEKENLLFLTPCSFLFFFLSCCRWEHSAYADIMNKELWAVVDKAPGDM